MTLWVQLIQIVCCKTMVSQQHHSRKGKGLRKARPPSQVPYDLPPGVLRTKLQLSSSTWVHQPSIGARPGVGQGVACQEQEEGPCPRHPLHIQAAARQPGARWRTEPRQGCRGQLGLRTSREARMLFCALLSDSPARGDTRAWGLAQVVHLKSLNIKSMHLMMD